ncbi:U6 snRNA-associated Sm-like protein LSm4 [Pancytospora epiphaga]|nr:U6 snRNA-associated Sm-like protein LSm4 [Pancytospora epiphaga]
MYPLTFIRLSKKRKITLRLVNDQTVAGTLAECDIAMNLHLTDATVTPDVGKPYFTKNCFLRGQSIQYVKIDKTIMGKQHLFD